MGASNTASTVKDSRSASSNQLIDISDTVTLAGGIVAGGGGDATSGVNDTAGELDLFQAKMNCLPPHIQHQSLLACSRWKRTNILDKNMRLNSAHQCRFSFHSYCPDLLYPLLRDSTVLILSLEFLSFVRWSILLL